MYEGILVISSATFCPIGESFMCSPIKSPNMGSLLVVSLSAIHPESYVLLSCSYVSFARFFYIPCCPLFGASSPNYSSTMLSTIRRYLAELFFHYAVHYSALSRRTLPPLCCSLFGAISPNSSSTMLSTIRRYLAEPFATQNYNIFLNYAN